MDLGHLEQLAALIRLLKEQEVSEFTYKDQERSLKLRLGGVAMAPAAMAWAAPPAGHAATAPPPAPAEAGLHVIESPMVGTLYTARSPGAEPLVAAGKRVNVGDVLCIIEAMKLMNQIEAEVSGTLVEVLVKNGQPVEYGQAMFKIRPG